MTAPPDYEFQVDVIAEAERELAAGEKVLLVAPTGSGKTVKATEIIKGAVARGAAVLFLAHRREIIAQTSAKLKKYGLRLGVIQSGIDPRPMERVQVASIQTLFVRSVKSNAMLAPLVDLLVIDEAHHAPAMTYRKIISTYPNAKILGLDRNAVPGRWSWAGQHLHQDRRGAAGRRADRARVPRQDQGLRAGRSEPQGR